MLSNEHRENDISGITHSPYYGCTIRVISKANVSYEGILDGISKNKDRIILKKVRVNGNINEFKTDPDASIEEYDALNAVMINHLINDIHIYDHVCLNVRDIRELNLLHLPASFREAKEKLHAIDPCLVDIRLSSAEQCETKPVNLPAPIARRPKSESFGSFGSSGIGFSSSNDSSSSLSDHQSVSSYAMEHHRNPHDTLVVKKILPRRNERRSQQNTRSLVTESHRTELRAARPNPSFNSKRSPVDVQNHKMSPIQIPITSKLNPNATPFYSSQRSSTGIVNSQQFYSSTQARMRIQPSDMHHRFIPPRQMAFNKPLPLLQNRFVNSRFTSRPPTINKTRFHSFYPVGVQDTAKLIETPSTRPNQNLRSTMSLPFHHGSSSEHQSFTHAPCFRSQRARAARTISGTSSGSNLSLDTSANSTGPYDSTSSELMSDDGQYDFEKANKEFRRYLELEELVKGRPLSICSTGSNYDNLSLSSSYKKDMSFFDRISCTATTGTAVAYNEIDELQKNRQTFGDDALLMASSSSDDLGRL